MLSAVACIVVCATAWLDLVSGHGMLTDPPARNTMWRYGYNTPKNFNDMGLNCGGAGVQWSDNQGKCGLCGDSYSGSQMHVAGGQYAPVDRPIAKCYSKDSQTIPITVRITAYHKGYFEFTLCENNDLTTDPGQDCVNNGRRLTVAGTQGETRFDINGGKQLEYKFALNTPDVTCTQCILRWKYNTGNSWGCDAEGCGIGNGPQEQFINCADIAILEDCSNMATVEPGTTVEMPETTPYYSTTKAPTQGTTYAATTVEIPDESDDDDDDDDDDDATGRLVCVPTEVYALSPGMQDWCNVNCNHPLSPYCPESHCVCD